MKENDQLNICDFGALPESGGLCTAALQAALDAANNAGGGTVVIPRGVFLTGTVNLGSASLRLEKGAVLKGSPGLSDYSFCGYRHNEMGDVLPLLYSMGGQGIRLSGEGTIDLNGDAFFDFGKPRIPPSKIALTEEQKMECTVSYNGRPNQPIFFYRCSNVTVEGLTIVNAPCWTFSFAECDTVRMLDLTIDNNLRVPNNDGMHFCCSRNILIRGCSISSGDDCIAFTGITDWEIPCQDAVVSDCILKTCSKAILIGYMHSIVRNISVSNVIISESNRGICVCASERTGLVENVTISNIQIQTRIRAGNWWGNGEPVLMMGTWHNYDRYALPAPNRNLDENICNVRISSAIIHADNAIGIVGANGNIRNIKMDGLTICMNESVNMAVKGKVLDLAPSEQIETLPQDGNDYWLHVQDAQSVEVADACVEPFHGKIPMASLRDSPACKVEFHCK